MASAASSMDEYERLKTSVIEEKKDGKVSPDKLYKLASLVARWKPKDRLPVCLLCRDLRKKPTTLGHLFPHSILKKVGNEKFFNFIRGAEDGVSNMGYYAFCTDCEKLFQQGEVHFNRDFFAPLCRKPAEKIKKIVILSNNNFPWLYYCLISIIWRVMCFFPLNEEYFPILEKLGCYLLHWKTVNIDTNVKLFLFVPNDEIDKKVGSCKTKKEFFYNTFWAKELEPVIDVHFRLFWVFCGPLHVVMIYSEENFKKLKNSEDVLEWEMFSMLRTQTKEFKIGEKATRFFPVDFYDNIVKRVSYACSAITRLPSVGIASNESPAVIEGSYLHLLPKDVSYDSRKDEFNFNSKTFIKKTVIYLYERITIVCVKQGSKNIIFVAMKDRVVNGDEVAIGLDVNENGKVQYMNGVKIPTNVKVNVDLNEPPYKQEIEQWISDFNIRKEFIEFCIECNPML